MSATFHGIRGKARVPPMPPSRPDPPSPAQAPAGVLWRTPHVIGCEDFPIERGVLDELHRPGVPTCLGTPRSREGCRHGPIALDMHRTDRVRVCRDGRGSPEPEAKGPVRGVGCSPSRRSISAGMVAARDAHLACLRVCQASPVAESAPTCDLAFFCGRSPGDHGMSDGAVLPLLDQKPDVPVSPASRQHLTLSGHDHRS